MDAKSFPGFPQSMFRLPGKNARKKEDNFPVPIREIIVLRTGGLSLSLSLNSVYIERAN